MCAANHTIKKVRRQFTEWEKVSARYISDKGLISKIYKELLQLKNKNTTDFKNGRMI